MKERKSLDEVLEGYKPIPMKRLFYPRGMKLSEDFINAFHREYDRLVGEGINPKSLLERFNKALTFHVNDPRKYKLLDEEQAALEEGRGTPETVKKIKRAPVKRDRQKSKKDLAATTSKIGQNEEEGTETPAT